MDTMATASHAERPIVPAWAPRLLLLTAAALVPWTILLFLDLPRRHVAHHWDLAWTGFDVALAAALAATAYGIARRAAIVRTSATVAATLLICDAWFDMTTSGDDTQFWLAFALAVGIEIPLAVVCVWITRRTRTVA